MNIQTIPLSALHAHPGNSNVMSAAMLNKLIAHLRRSDRYPPLIVRTILTAGSAARGKACFSTPVAPAPGSESESPAAPHVNAAPSCADQPQYQILDGHHRAVALKKLGRDSARCVVWEVDDDESMLLLATLNRLQGQDDPRKRAQLLQQLQTKLPRLEALLPEAKVKLQRLLTLARSQPPTPRPPQVAEQLPVPVHFFLPPPQKKFLESKLAEVGGPREQALMTLAGWTGQTFKEFEHGATHRGTAAGEAVDGVDQG